MGWATGALVVAAMHGASLAAEKPEAWTFDPNSWKLTCPSIHAGLRPLGDMHGLFIEKLGDAGSPVSPGRAFLNLEHYLEKGRAGEYFPRKLDQTALLTRKSLSVRFPEQKPWPVVSELVYRFPECGTIDATLHFTFTEAMTQFEVYFTSYFDGSYERSIRVDKAWMQPEISDREQLLIPRDDRIASRFEDGRWSFLGDRTRLAEYRFDLPIMVSTSEETGWTVVQMIEPGTCTHIAPNRFAVGHNFIIGGWDVKKGEKRSARIRMIFGQKLSAKAIEKAYQAFADECRQAHALDTARPVEIAPGNNTAADTKDEPASNSE